MLDPRHPPPANTTTSAATLTALIAKPVESLTIADLRTLEDAVKRLSKGHDPQTTIGSLLT